MTQLAAVILHVLHALTVITLLAVLLVNVFYVHKFQTANHVKVVIQINAYFAKMVTMLKLMELVINVPKGVHYVQVLFSVHLLLMVITLL